MLQSIIFQLVIGEGNNYLPSVAIIGRSIHSVTCQRGDSIVKTAKGIWQNGQLPSCFFLCKKVVEHESLIMEWHTNCLSRLAKIGTCLENDRARSQYFVTNAQNYCIFYTEFYLNWCPLGRFRLLLHTLSRLTFGNFLLRL